MLSNGYRKTAGGIRNDQTDIWCYRHHEGFPSHLVRTARNQITALLHRLSYDYVMVGENDTQYGAIVSYEEAGACANLFRNNRTRISGIIGIFAKFRRRSGRGRSRDLADAGFRF